MFLLSFVGTYTLSDWSFKKEIFFLTPVLIVTSVFKYLAQAIEGLFIRLHCGEESLLHVIGANPRLKISFCINPCKICYCIHW